ncbi:MAG: hypothetical protein ABW003_12930 [Microvirga sp.]
MSDYTETEPTTPFAKALDELVKRFVGEGTPIEEIAATLEEAALQAGDEELDENDEWRKRVR